MGTLCEYFIRPMGQPDLKALAAIEKECFSQPWSELALAAELYNPQAHFFVAHCGTVICGYAGMHAIAGEGYVDNIAVTARYRGRGIGRALTQQLLERSASLSLAFLTLEVRVGNQRAIGLYESLGFDKIGVRPRFYENPQEDALIMTHSLRF